MMLTGNHDAARSGRANDAWTLIDEAQNLIDQSWTVIDKAPKRDDNAWNVID